MRDISADVITRRFRAKIAAFWREKEMTIFFASMAHHFSEHAFQAVSRESIAALIPLEKHATLTQPLRQNTSKSARNFTGADRDTRSLRKVEQRDYLTKMVCSYLTFARPRKKPR